MSRELESVAAFQFHETPCDNEGVKTVDTSQSLEILSVRSTPDTGADDHTTAREFCSLTAS